MFSRTTIKFLKGEHFKRENENIILTGVIDAHLKKNELKKNGKELGINIFFILLMKSCTRKEMNTLGSHSRIRHREIKEPLENF